MRDVRKRICDIAVMHVIRAAESPPLAGIRTFEGDCWLMDAWIGLVGVIAGAVVTLGGQYVTRRSEALERQQALLLEQCALLVALSGDYLNRVWEERNQLATGVVASWDLGAYRIAQARLRILCRKPDVLLALDTLSNTGGDLGKAWRLTPDNAGNVDAALDAHRAALDAFTAASSRLLQLRRGGLREDLQRRDPARSYAPAPSSTADEG
jgi:hypothetical protein